MPLNPFFLQGSASEQRLVQDLVNEQLRMYGIEVYYLPREIKNRKNVFQEVQSSEFDDNYLLEAYVNTYDGYTGGGDVLTKFGMQLKDELVVTISKERWEDYIAPFLAMGDAYETELAHRPREGDLIYFPLGGRFFEVKFVEHESPFYQLQKNYVYELQCELFEYENEVIDTGIEAIDNKVSNVGEIINLKMIGYGNTATIGVQMETGYVRQIYLNDDGYGYYSTPTVTFSAAPGGGRTATAVAITTSIGGQRSIKEIVLTDAGKGYVEEPTVTITGGGGVGAAVTVGIETYRQGVSKATIISSGNGYTDTPIITFGSPTYTGAAGTAVVANNVVTGITLSSGGSNYAPQRQIGVTISPPTGAGLVQGTANTAIANQKLVSLSVNNAGIGYSVEPAVTIAAPTGVGSTAVVTATVNANENLETISIASSGQFYVGNPILTVDAPTGIASTATANTSYVSNLGITTFSYSLTSAGRYYLSPPTLTIKYLTLSAGFDATSPRFGSVAWKLIDADSDRNLTHRNQTTLGAEGAVQLFFKTQSSTTGVSTFLELNKNSNGSKAEDTNLRINTNGNVELGIGTVSIASTVGGSVRDDAWHYAYVESKTVSGSQRISVSVDGGDYASTFYPTAGNKELITNANLTPPILKNSYNSGIFVDDIFSTIIIGSASSTPPSSGISSYTVDSNTVTYDDFEDQIGSEQELSIDTTVVSGQVASLVNSSSTLTGIVTAINSAVIDLSLIHI